jgi:hypothetical protein
VQTYPFPGEHPSDSPGVLDQTKASNLPEANLAYTAATLDVGLIPIPPLILHQF